MSLFQVNILVSLFKVIFAKNFHYSNFKISVSTLMRVIKFFLQFYCLSYFSANRRLSTMKVNGKLCPRFFFLWVKNNCSNWEKKEKRKEERGRTTICCKRNTSKIPDLKDQINYAGKSKAISLMKMESQLVSSFIRPNRSHVLFIDSLR